jgi:hypothetical protein
LAHVGDLLQFSVKATVDGAPVAEGQLVLSIAASGQETVPRNESASR